MIENLIQENKNMKNVKEASEKVNIHVAKDIPKKWAKK